MRLVVAVTWALGTGRMPDACRASAAQRNLVNRVIGQPYHCLKQGTAYDESLAFGISASEAVVDAA
ncbi:hypothetical protein AQJ54_40780 [Streptomyces griseorubiginosus]|uniref:Uncharacterized protein n=2 Tax=Streptomyces TaxID=1883 RepID=A0A101RND7_9ACTN|nr:hypothetical protein AQJ54_40780 [Streptomyces griseorubiginosus]